jgi:hypothetical protein
MSARAVAGGLAVFGAYLGFSAAARRWYRTWGATADEAREPLAGDSLIEDAVMQTTRAITIAASPEHVWPWLLQMGHGRGGLYTYTLIENALRADIHNLDRVDPGLQQLQLGDRVWLTPDPYLGRLPGQYYTVTEIRPREALVMLQQLPTGAITSWTFILRASGSEKARLLVRARASAPARASARAARALELLLLEPGYFLMERGMLRGIKHRAETLAGSAAGRHEQATPRRDRVPTILGEIVIERPIEEVFDVVADERNEPRYNPRLMSVEKTSSGPIGVGTRWRAKTTRGRRRIPMTIDVTAYDRPRRLASSTRLASMDITGELSFELVSAGTLIKWRWQLQPRGALKLLGPLIAHQGGRQEQAIWRNLKRFLEAPPSSVTAEGTNVGTTS